MPKIKSVSSYNGVNWSAAVPIGVDDINIDITSETTDPNNYTDYDTTHPYFDLDQITVLPGNAGNEAWTKYNKFKNRVIFNGAVGFDGAGPHNCMYRGLNLGSSIDSWVYDEIDSGRFRNLFIGDYWIINGITWRIAAFDYWYNKGVSGGITCNTHHIVIVPDQILLTGFFHHTNVQETINSKTVYPTDGGYIGLDFNTGANGNTNKSALESIVNAAFGSQNILIRPFICSNSAIDGKAQSWFFGTTKVELMNTLMVTGTPTWSTNNAPESEYDVGFDDTQLPLFYFDRQRIESTYENSPRAYYLRDIACDANHHGIYTICIAAGGQMSDSQVWRSGNTYGFRPAFGLMKGTT